MDWALEWGYHCEKTCIKLNINYITKLEKRDNNLQNMDSIYPTSSYVLLTNFFYIKLWSQCKNKP